MRSSSSSSSGAPSSLVLGGGPVGFVLCSISSCSRSRAVSEKRRSTFDFVSERNAIKVVISEVVKCV